MYAAVFRGTNSSIPAGVEARVQLAGQRQQERGLAGGRRAEQERHPGGPYDPGHVLEDVERLPLREVEADQAQQPVGHVPRRVRQRSGPDVALRCHVQVAEPHLHRRDLDPSAGTELKDKWDAAAEQRTFTSY
jgi:hypothetical protein